MLGLGALAPKTQVELDGTGIPQPHEDAVGSLFERRVEVIADVGFDGRVTRADWQTIIDAMAARLPSGRPADAIGRGLDRLESLLEELRIEPEAGSPDELPNRPIEPGT